MSARGGMCRGGVLGVGAVCGVAGGRCTPLGGGGGGDVEGGEVVSDRGHVALRVLGVCGCM